MIVVGAALAANCLFTQDLFAAKAAPTNIYLQPSFYTWRRSVFALIKTYNSL